MRSKSLLGHNIEQSQGAILSQDISKIVDTSDRIKGVLDNDEQQLVVNNYNKLNELLGELELEVKKISDEIGYCYDSDDYKLRLSQNDDIFDESFSELLGKHSELNGTYSELKNFISDLPNPDLIEKMIIKQCLSNLVYESMNGNFGAEKGINIKDLLEVIKTPDSTIDYQKLQNYICKNNINFIELGEVSFFLFFYGKLDSMLSFMNKLYEFGIRRINFHLSVLHSIVNDDNVSFFNIINLIGGIGFKSIELFFGKVFSRQIGYNLKQFNHFISLIGNSELKHLQLSQFILNEIFQDDINSSIDFVKLIGLSGVKSLFLYYCGLNDFFKDNSRLLIDFVRVAGESGIRDLSFTETQLPDLIRGEISILQELLKTAGESGIVSFALVVQDLDMFLMFDYTIFVESIKAAGESGIKVLDFGKDIRDNILKSHYALEIEKAIEKYMQDYGIIIKHY